MGLARARARERIDVLAEEIAMMPVAERIKLLSAIREHSGQKVLWESLARIQRRARLKETPALHREINAVVHEDRRARRRST